MADKTIAGSVLNIDGTVFIDELLEHVFKAYGITRDSRLPDPFVSTLRSVAIYTFSPVIGDGVLHKMSNLPSGLAETCIEKANDLRLETPNPGEYLTNYLLYAKVEILTQDVFKNERSRWCTEVFDYIVLITDLCVHLHQTDQLSIFSDVVSVAGNTFHQLVNEESAEKMTSLCEHATSILQNAANADNADSVIYLE